jgi:hypothetical protein
MTLQEQNAHKFSFKLQSLAYGRGDKKKKIYIPEDKEHTVKVQGKEMEGIHLNL